jgi:glucokinase
MFAFAVDIGGSGVRAAALDASGMPTTVARRPLSASLDFDETWSTIVGCLREVTAGSEIDTIGVSFPAFLSDDGCIQGIVNLPALQGVDLAERLTTDTGSRLTLPIPDLGATVVAEARRGAGAGRRRVLATGIGTGVNAAIAVDGDLFAVALGALGDAGHVIVEPDGPRCACGGRGCLEAICSGAALDAEARRLGWSGAKELGERAYADDLTARAVLERAGRGLGRAIASWSAMLVPDVVVVAGRVALIGAALLDPAREELRRVGSPQWASELDVVLATFPVDAALIGAGLLAHKMSTVVGHRAAS